jgi:Ni/Fe-hydrogenase subunit HybB-like protein
VSSSSTPKSAALFGPIKSHSSSSYALGSSLLAIALWGVYAYYVQFTTGLGVTGMRSVVSWAFYIINFVFFIGISHVGALMSAILRLTNAEWRKPITRIAEVVTFASLMMAVMMPLIDLGRPDRLLYTIIFARVQSPLAWDFLAIGTYMIGSTIFLYLPMIPDIASCRDKLEDASKFRRWLYGKLSLGWNGSPGQWNHLEKAIKMMSIIIIPIAISVHTVVSWDFAMLFRTGWNSTIFGPYFVSGALLSGVATVILVMAFLTKYYHLENYITKRHFDNLGKLLIALDIIVIYFTINENLVPGYKFFDSSSPEGQWMASLLWGQYATFFWVQLIGGLVIPAFLIGLPRTRTITGYLVASLLVDVGMWIERFNIIVPTLALPQLSYSWGSYVPTWVELSIVAGTFAGFTLIYFVFSRLFPIISIWETEETSAAGAKVFSPPSMGLTLQTKHTSPMALSKRSFLRYGAFAIVGFALGFAPIQAPIRSSNSNGNRSSVPVVPLSNLGVSVSLAEAKKAVGLSISQPTKPPPGSKLKDVRVSGDNHTVSLIYENPLTKPLSLYNEDVALIIIQSQDALNATSPAYLPSDFTRVEVAGHIGFTREPSQVSASVTEPGQLQWWRNGVRYAIFANSTINEMTKTAESMEAL